MTTRHFVTRLHPDDRVDPGKAGPQVMRHVTVNVAESPLAWLAARGMVSDAHYRAGERLRTDYERAGLAGRVTMRWDAAPPSKSRGLAGAHRRASTLPCRGGACRAGTGRHLLAGDLCGRGDRRRRKGAGVAIAIGQAGFDAGA